MRNCVCFVTHKYDYFIKEQWNKLATDLFGMDVDLVMLFDKTSPQSQADFEKLSFDVQNKAIIFPHEAKVFNFNELGIRQILETKGYSLEYYEGIQNLFYGNIMAAYMAYYNINPTYDYYWFIEWDVAFNGSWRDLIFKYDVIPDDYISRSCKEGIEYNDGWFHANQWKTTTLKPFTYTELMVTFNPIMRLSNEALQFLDQVYSEGNSGFYEIFLGTVLKREGFTVSGFKEYGDLDMSTFTWIPRDSIDVKNIKGLRQLLHPVKSHIGIPMTIEELENLKDKKE